MWDRDRRWVRQRYVHRDSDSASYLSDDMAARPRVAVTWRWIQWEEIRKGDHFRIIDPARASLHKPWAAEDGRTVYVAASSAGWMDKVWMAVLINPVHAYPGRGAGFDWYEVEYPRIPVALAPENAPENVLRKIQDFV